MGLDVYLKHSTNRADALARQEQASAYENEVWDEAGSYNELTDEKRAEIRANIKAFNAQIGVGEYGEALDIETIEMDSKLYPTSMFKVGYLRSSYNSGGINSVLRRIGCPDLYDIFQPGDEYNVTVDWAGARERAVESVAALKAYMNSEMGQYDVIEVNGYDPVGSKEEALALLKKELGHKSAFGGGYSNRAGDWFPEGLQIVGAVPGQPSFMGTPTYYLFTKNTGDDNNFKWYVESLEVTLEMIDYVLAQPDPDNYFLAWSA